MRELEVRFAGHKVPANTGRRNADGWDISWNTNCLAMARLLASTARSPVCGLRSYLGKFVPEMRSLKALPRFEGSSEGAQVDGDHLDCVGRKTSPANTIDEIY